MRALKMSSVVPSHWKLTIAIESYHKSWSSYNYTRSCSITQHWPFYGDWHLKQIERWKISMRGCLFSWPKIKRSCHFEVSSFLRLHSNNELSRLNVTCDKKWILYDNQWWPAQWWPKKKKLQIFPKSNLHQKRSWSLFGGLLPTWSMTAFWILVKPLHLRNMLSKLMGWTENCNA